MGFGDWLSSHPLPPFILGLIIGIPSVILYVIEVVILLKHWRQLNSAFFRLFLVRFTLIWKYMLPISIVLTLVLPLPFTAPMLTYKFFTRLQADNYTFTLSFLSDENDLSIAPNVLGVKHLNPSTVAAFSAALFFIVCGTLNVFTIVLFNLHARGKLFPISNSRSEQQKQTIESKLTIYAVITFLGHLFMAIYNIAMTFCCVFGAGWDFMFLATFNQLPWVSDFSTIAIPSWALLWASSTIRQLMVKELRLQKWPVLGAYILKSESVEFMTSTVHTGTVLQ